VKIELVVLWVVAPYSMMVGNQRFGGREGNSAVDISPWPCTSTLKMEATHKARNSFFNRCLYL